MAKRTVHINGPFTLNRRVNGDLESITLAPGVQQVEEWVAEHEYAKHFITGETKPPQIGTPEAEAFIADIGRRAMAEARVMLAQGRAKELMDAMLARPAPGPTPGQFASAHLAIKPAYNPDFVLPVINDDPAQSTAGIQAADMTVAQLRQQAGPDGGRRGRK